MKTVSRILLLIFTLSAMTLADEPQSADKTPTRMLGGITLVRSYFEPHDFKPSGNFTPVRIGLALSGGGARGIAQIGVLKALEEEGLYISDIAGSSMGSIIGGLYATGYSAEEIEVLTRDINFASLFSDSPQRQSLFFTQRTERDRYLLSIRFDGVNPYIPKALAAGQRLTSLLTDLTIQPNYICGNDFNRLKIPFRAVATDIGTGEMVILDHGSLADAMRASMAFPLAFTPVELEGRYLMDGGIVAPVPVTVCREMGADFVIAINTASKLMPAENVNDPIDIAGQVTTIMAQNAMTEQLSQADIVIKPELLDLETFDFLFHDSLVMIGYQAGKKAIKAIKEKLSDRDHNNNKQLDYVTIAHNSKYLKEIKENFPVKSGEYINPEILDRALNHADNRFLFYRLSADVRQVENKIIIVLDGQVNQTTDIVEYKLIGNKIMPDSVLLPIFINKTSGVLSITDVKEAADSVISLYHLRGHDLARIRSIGYDHQNATVTIAIDEGLLRYVDIRGNKRTRDWIVKANYPLRPGSPFDTHESEKGIGRIYGTGFFERVSLDIQPTEDGAHLTINVKEKKFTQLRLGAHWDDEYQGEGFADILDDNVLGAGLQVLAHARLSSRRYDYHLAFKADRMSRTLFMAETKFYFSRLRRRLFQPDGSPNGIRVEDRLGLSLILGQQIERFGNIYFQYRVEDINTRLTIPDIANDEVLSVLAIKSTVETYNRFPFPDKGQRQYRALEFSGKSLGSSYDEYTRLTGSIEGYFPVGRYANLHPRISAGISTADLPDIEKFYIGGMYDFFGYRTHQLAGDKMFVSSLQLRIKLPYRFYLIAEYDYGNVFDDYENIKIRDFRNGAGIVLAWDTPLGPFEVGYGKADAAPDRLYLNLGLRF